MSWGAYQKCIILRWFHRGIGFLQMEQPFTRSLRAPTPAVIGSHDIWSVGMTRVWQRRGSTVSIPIVSQTNLLCISAVFLHLFCALRTSLRSDGIEYFFQCGLRWRANTRGGGGELLGASRATGFQNVFAEILSGKFLRNEYFLLQTQLFRRNICYAHSIQKEIFDAWRSGSTTLLHKWKSSVCPYSAYRHPALLSQEIPRKSQVPDSYYST